MKEVKKEVKNCKTTDKTPKSKKQTGAKSCK